MSGASFGLLAHGGTAGLIVELSFLFGVISVVAVVLLLQRRDDDDADDEAEELPDDYWTHES